MTTTVQFIKDSLDFAHRALADARNATEEQLHWVPENGSHSIAWTLWHTARIEDLILAGRILNEPQTWNADWAKRTGLPAEGFGTGQSDEEAQQVRIADLGALAEYQEAVWARTLKFLDSITDEDLERQVPTRTGTEGVGEGIRLHILGHFNGHRGEINLLRGMQGLRPLLAAEGTH